MYKAIATLMGVADLIFASIWLLKPHAFPELWIMGETGCSVLEPRLVLLLAGIGVLLLLSRNAPPSQARSAICIAGIFGTLCLAIISLYELWSGIAGPGVLPGVGFNLFFALAFAVVEWNARNEAGEARRD